ncbi:hypothetical protein [Roseovarius azorensis]|uniref:hypothetical protein n=1 Tax=Roseovarius azorensis TaxID=1287727 RepID=UPI001587C4B3|nr:hypothetical protein [Roseovarius azorensis]
MSRSYLAPAIARAFEIAGAADSAVTPRLESEALFSKPPRGAQRSLSVRIKWW